MTDINTHLLMDVFCLDCGGQFIISTAGLHGTRGCSAARSLLPGVVNNQCADWLSHTSSHMLLPAKQSSLAPHRRWSRTSNKLTFRVHREISASLRGGSGRFHELRMLSALHICTARWESSARQRVSPHPITDLRVCTNEQLTCRTWRVSPAACVSGRRPCRCQCWARPGGPAPPAPSLSSSSFPFHARICSAVCSHSSKSKQP